MESVSIVNCYHALKKRGINVIAVDTNEERRKRALRNGIRYVFSGEEIEGSNYIKLINKHHFTTFISEFPVA